MRVKDMQPGTAYATCDGIYVELRDPLRRGWFTTTWGKDDARVTTFHDVTDLDPWGPCVDAIRPPAVGVLCDQYEVDRDGVKREDTRTETVVNPRDIKGTWIDYLVLHAQTVRERGIERERHETISRVDELVATVNQPRDVGLRWSGYDVKWHHGLLEPSGRGQDEFIEAVEVRFMLTPDGFIEFMRRLGITVPADVVTELRERYRSADDWDALQAQRDQQRSKTKVKAGRR